MKYIKPLRNLIENWELEIHIKEHREAETYSCDECDKSIVLIWRLEKHKKVTQEKYSAIFIKS